MDPAVGAAVAAAAVMTLVGGVALAYRTRAQLCLGIRAMPRRSSIGVRLELGPVCDEYPGAFASPPPPPASSLRVLRAHATLAAGGDFGDGFVKQLVQGSPPRTPESSAVAPEFDAREDVHDDGMQPALDGEAQQSASVPGLVPAGGPAPSGFSAHEWRLEVPIGGLGGGGVGLVLKATPDGRATVHKVTPGGVAYRSHGGIVVGDVLVAIDGRGLDGDRPMSGPVATAKASLLAAVRDASACGDTVCIRLHRPAGAAVPRGPVPPPVV